MYNRFNKYLPLFLQELFNISLISDYTESTINIKLYLVEKFTLLDLNYKQLNKYFTFNIYVKY